MYEAWKINPNNWCVDSQGRCTGNERHRLISRHRLARRALAVMGRTVGVWKTTPGAEDVQLSHLDLEILAEKEAS